jgi:hypothetical protein
MKAGGTDLEQEKLHDLGQAALGGVDGGREVHLVFEVYVDVVAVGQQTLHLGHVPVFARLGQLETRLWLWLE